MDPSIDLNGGDLAGADLTGKDLSGANLFEAFLIGADSLHQGEISRGWDQILDVLWTT